MNTFEASNLSGNYHVRRAVEVSLAARASLLLIGPPRSDARPLALWLHGPSYSATYIRPLSPCPCGAYGDPTTECGCDLAAIKGHRRHLRPCAMVVEVCRPDFGTIGRDPWDLEAMAARVSAARSALHGAAPLGPRGLDRECFDLLKEAYEQLRMWPSDVSQVVRVARSVAALDSADRINAAHLLEAIQYKAGALRE